MQNTFCVHFPNLNISSSDILNTEQALDHVLSYHDAVRDLDGSIRDG